MRQIIALTALLAGPSLAAGPDFQTWFAASMKGGKPALESAAVPLDEVAAKRKELYDSYRKAAIDNGWDKKFLPPNDLKKNAAGKVELRSGKYTIGEGLVMPYITMRKGERPPNGWPLAIAMHGGGGTSEKLANPHAWPINSKEWDAQIKLVGGMYPGNMIYFVPRMVDDNRGRWWREWNHQAFQTLIRHAILFWDVDPNRIYMLGISEGGYGTENLACRYPEKLAAATGLACGSGTSIHVENLRNLPFRTDVGETDNMFDRRPNAVKKHALIEEYRAKDPAGYINHLEVHKGRGHGIYYKPGVEWLLPFTRNPHPDRVTYTIFTNDNSRNEGAYWLRVISDLDKKTVFLDARMDRKTNTIDISAKAADEVVQRPDAQQALIEPGQAVDASGLKLRLWLHESLLDLAKPVEVKINGKPVTTLTPSPDTAAMAESLLFYGDPECIYPAKVDVTVP